jgi:MFS family permease
VTTDSVNPDAPSPADGAPSLPPPDAGPLVRNRPFLASVVTQFLGAFNDNLFKQVVLLFAVVVVIDGEPNDLQGVINAVFALAFLIFAGLAGELSDRMSKGRMIVWCKVAEIGVMALATVVFYVGVADESGIALPTLILLTGLTFVMGSQSAFFGPPKYGVIPELVAEKQVAPASGTTQASTMVAIIVGIALAGILKESLGDANVWIIGVACVGVAIIGTLASLGITRRPAVDPERPIGAASFGAMLPTVGVFLRNLRSFGVVVIGYSYLWGMGAFALLAINAFGKLQLGLDDAMTSYMVAMISLGIAIGNGIAGALSRNGVNLKLAIIGAVGIAVCFGALGLLPADSPAAPPAAPTAVTGSESVPAAQAPAPDEIVWASFVLLLGAGVSAGMMLLPLLAFLQLMPPERDRGRVLAAASWVSWLFITAGGIVYSTLAALLSPGQVFLVTGGATALVAVILLPSIVRLRVTAGGAGDIFRRRAAGPPFADAAAGSD